MEEIPSHTENRFGDAYASGDGIAFQAGINNGTININQRARQTVLPKVSSDARFDAANKEHLPGCLEGTRVELLKEIQTWIDGPDPKKIYWLSGMSGTGKSTIALTLARVYKRMVDRHDRKRNVCLGATFFFSRGGGDLSSASKFPATIATQLAEASVELRTLIESAFDDNPGLDGLGIGTQWEKLILEPLSRLSETSADRKTFLLIVDALDECDNGMDTNVIIRCLEQATRVNGVACRVFLTSRPEQSIRLGMDDSASEPRENFVLHNIERSIVNQDLRLYYEDQLYRIQAIISPGKDILSQRTIEKLVERSNGLFIHAATVCRLVREGKWLAVERLNNLMETESSNNAELELDKIYTTVLEYSSVSVTGGLNEDEVKKVYRLLQRVLGAIIVMFDVMSSERLAMLLGVEREEILTALSALHSVIDVPECHSQPIRIIHPSFREFLLDPKRCTDNFYSIPVPDTHGYLLTRCFTSLMSQLKRNLLNISKPGAKAKDISIGRIDKLIPKELQYSSIYWWNHFRMSNDQSRKAVPLLEFLEGKYLFWLECLVWLGKLGHAIEAMFDMNDLFAGKQSKGRLSFSMPFNYPKSKTASQLKTFVPDALEFLLRNKLMIEEAPLQLYVSALIFSPNWSQVRKKNRQEVPRWILNEPNVLYSWSGPPRGLEITLSSVIYSIAVSPNSSIVVAACGDQLIHVFDVINGTEKFRLKGNPDGVASVCFSPDGSLVASFAQNCLSVWNLQAALGAIYEPECQFRFRRQKDKGESSKSPSFDRPMCAISPSSNLVTAVDYPDDIWVWDMRVEHSAKYHFQVGSQRSITGVYFSSDGSLLISNSVLPPAEKFQNCDKDSIGIIDAWHTSTGIKVPTERSISKGPLLGMVSGTRYITTSPPVSNGKPSLIIRDARTGLDHMRIPLISRPEYPMKVLCRPSDGKFLLAERHGPTIVLRTPRDKYITEEKYCSSAAKSMEFSPNGKYLIAADPSDELRIWNIENLGSKSSRLAEMHQALRSMRKRVSSFHDLLFLIVSFMSWGIPIFPYRYGFNWYRDLIRSRDGSLLATARTGSLLAPDTIRSAVWIWDLKTGERYRLNIPKHSRSAQFSLSGNVFAVLSNFSVYFWETKTGQKGDKLKIDSHRRRGYGDLKISAKAGKIIYIQHDISNGDISFELHGWELDGLRKSSSFEITGQTLPIQTLVSPRAFRLHPNRFCMAISPSEELYCVWSPLSRALDIGSFPNSSFNQRTTLRNNVELAEFMPDGKNILILGEPVEGQRQAIHIWNLERECLREIHIDLPLAVKSDIPVHSSALNPAKYVPHYKEAFISPDGKLVALIDRDSGCRELKIFDLETFFLSSLQSGSRQNVVGFSPSGTQLVTSRGCVPVPGSSSPFPQLFATKNWVQEDGEDILAIPPVYRSPYSAICAINGHTITIRDSSYHGRGLFFVRLDDGVKTMTA